MENKKENISLIGGGPACMIAALFLSERFKVTLYEKGKTIGRKFLVAGNGGFNLTNALNGDLLKAKYIANKAILNSLDNFSTAATRTWFKSIGIETFVGSSGRVFPLAGIKPIEVLNALILELKKNQVEIKTKHEFIGFSESKRPLIKNENSTFEISNGHVIFGLGGGSWRKTGSNAKWLAYFKSLGIKTLPFQASNAGVNIEWPQSVIQRCAGFPLKNIAATVAQKTVKGELIITNYGLEGNALYPLSPHIRKLLRQNQYTNLTIDFKPNNTIEQLVEKIKAQTKPKNYGFIFNLNKNSLQIIKTAINKETYLNPREFAKAIKKTPLKIVSLRPIEEAISTVGGIPLEEIDANFELTQYPGYFIIGEMLDWDAPTGGFLLQGCFSSGHQVAQYILKQQ